MSKKNKAITITIIAVTTSILVVCIAFVIVLTTVIVPDQQYQEAIEKNSSALKDASVGDIVKFGAYEQDNNSSNGKEEIEWSVLAKESDRILIISKYALDCQKYNSSDSGVTWESCSLRKWLNGSFANSAFNGGERKMIAHTNVTADKNPSYGTSPGNDTTDKVFLLSITEVNKYFISDSDRQCQGTAYCYAQGAYKTGNSNCWWWLRSPGYYSSDAAVVCDDGSVSDLGYNVYDALDAVRPALWLNLELH